MSLAEARERLSELVDDIERTGERAVITRDGREAAVLIAPGDLAALEETLEVQGDSELMGRLAESEEDVRAGRVLDAEDVAALMAERKAPGGP